MWTFLTFSRSLYHIHHHRGLLSVPVKLKIKYVRIKKIKIYAFVNSYVFLFQQISMSTEQRTIWWCVGKHSSNLLISVSAAQLGKELKLNACGVAVIYYVDKRPHPVLPYRACCTACVVHRQNTPGRRSDTGLGSAWGRTQHWYQMTSALIDATNKFMWKSAISLAIIVYSKQVGWSSWQPLIVLKKNPKTKQKKRTFMTGTYNDQ